MKVSFAVACLLGLASAQEIVTVEQPNDLTTCIADVEALIPGVEKVIADFKAGDYTSALTDALALEPDVQKAITDCTTNEKQEKLLKFFGKLTQVSKPEDLTTCIADVEALIPGVEKVIADFKSGDYTSALTDALALEPDVQKAITDCTSKKNPFEKKVGDIQQCITDVEGLIPGIEKVIADLKAGNQNAAILQLTLMMPKIQAAYKECTGATTPQIKKIEQILKYGKPEDLTTCIADVEALIPGVEKVIADFKAGDYTSALTDALALEPDVQKAITDCTSKKQTPFGKPQDLTTCIADMEALIPDVEAIIADFKAGDYTKALTDALKLEPEVQKAITDCTSKEMTQKLTKFFGYFENVSKPEDLTTCIADVEALIPGVEKVIADFKAGDYTSALTDALALEPDVQKAITDCTSKKPQFGKPQDLTTCIADVEALIPGVEKVIADIKAGDYTSALTDGLALEPDVQKAITDCTSSVAPHMYRRIHHVKKMLMKIDVGDLPTCISDIESAIPDLEKIIADFKAGNYEQALTDGLALVPVIEKAATDCLSSAKALGGRFKTILKDDPKREYFEKLGAEFAVGFFAGTKVERFDSIDLYNCLHREPTAVEYFYKADVQMKYALQHHNEDNVVKALDELIGYLAELVMEDYPHSHVEVCREFKDREAQWGDLKMVLEDLKDKERTLQVHDHHFTFNHQDVTSSMLNLVDDYVHGEWSQLGFKYGSTLLDAAAHPHTEMFLQ